MTLPRRRILPVVDRDPRTVGEPTTATVNATTTENTIKTSAGIVRGRVPRPLVARVDVTNAMAVLRIQEVDGTTGERGTERKDMNTGRETRGMGRERILRTDSTRGNSGLGPRMSAKTEDRRSE